MVHTPSGKNPNGEFIYPNSCEGNPGCSRKDQHICQQEILKERYVRQMPKNGVLLTSPEKDGNILNITRRVNPYRKPFLSSLYIFLNFELFRNFFFKFEI